MKLKLKNFKTWRDIEFDFGEEGIVLISGRSGIGKSSILDAIYFALYGEGKNLVTFGEKSAKVELEYGNFSISRTKTPNKLILKDNENKKYEGTIAQEILISKFGKEESIYFFQDISETFIMASPSKKLEILETILNMNVNISNIRNKAKTLLKEREENHIKIKSKLEMTSEMLKNNHSFLPEKVNFPMGNEIENKELAIQEEIINRKNIILNISECKRDVENISKKLEKIRLNKELIKMKERDRMEINKKIELMKKDMNNLNYKGDSHLQNLDDILEAYNRDAEKKILEENLKLDKDQLNILMERNREIDSLLWKNGTKEETEKEIEELKEYYRDIEKYNELSSFLKKKEKECENSESIRNKLSEFSKRLDDLKSSYVCPKCDSRFRICNKKVILLEDKDSAINTDDLCKQINKLDISLKERLEEERMMISLKEIESVYENFDALTNLQELERDVTSLKEYLYNCLSLEREKNEMIKKKSISSLEAKIICCEKKLGKYSSSLEINNDDNNKDVVEKERKDQYEIKLKYEKLKSGIFFLEKKREDDEEKNNNFEESEKEEYIEKIKKEKEGQIEELERKKNTCDENLQTIEKWRLYCESLKRYMDMKNTEDGLIKEEKDFRDQSIASAIIVKKIKEAETLAITNLISSINLHSQIYLDTFFEDKQINVKLIPFKELKKGKVKKTQIDIKIDYEGMEGIGLSSLSGGERERIVLAFTLALSEINSSPLILLDESLKSLDHETASSVIKGIKENYKGNLCLMVVHQTVKGLFDKTIEL